MMNRSLLQNSVILSSRWVRLWFYLVGVAVLSIGLAKSTYTLLMYGAVLLLVGGIIQAVGGVLHRLQPKADNYAASVHRAMVERFFVEADDTQTVVRSIPELISRTSFNRPNKLRPLREAYQSMTVVVVFVAIASALHQIFNPNAVYGFATLLLIVYATDRWFGLRSYMYFQTQKHTPEQDTQHVEVLVKRFSKQLELDEEPEIVYSKNEEFIAGATNPTFRPAQLYISTALLEKQTHIQRGILSHEMAHIKLDETKLFTHKHIQGLIPLAILLFGTLPFSIPSVVGLTVVTFVLVVGVAMKRHTEEFEADDLASGLTDIEFIVLAILEFTNYNPFVESLPEPFDTLTSFVSTHPPTSERIQRLVEKSGQSFNSE